MSQMALPCARYTVIAQVQAFFWPLTPLMQQLFRQTQQYVGGIPQLLAEYIQ